MSSNAEAMRQAAGLLEKTAEYLEQHAAFFTQARVTQDQKYTKMAQSITALTGKAVDNAAIEKLASVSPEIEDVILKLAGGGSLDTMGGPATDTKHASEVSSESADDRMLDWLLTC